MNVAVLGSGRGSNFQAVLRAMRQDQLPDVRICAVISNNSGSGILEIARANGLPAIHLSAKQFPSAEQFVESLLATLSTLRTDLVVLAGYMKRLDAKIVRKYKNRIINIHPALLPAHGGEGMYGMHVHRSVIASGEKISGATVHMVDEEYDNGSILLQRRVDVDDGETPESLAKKVLEVEHDLLPEAIRLFSQGKLSVNEATRNVIIN